MASIRAIDDRTIHRIQSGQVIVDLTSVVKELVENSLDAGATSIDIRFKTHGLDLIEVQDNGIGISPQDYQSIARKHFTSKLSTYADLLSLNTYGFRGEALSSLCAVSRVHVITARDCEAPKGQRLDFEASGAVSGTSVTACEKGTTVSVEGLFHGLPVRRRELEKNIKREFSKVLALLHAYACISTDVKFTVSNQASKVQKTVVFATQANSTTRETITNIYGAKASNALMTLDLCFQMQPASESNEENGTAKHLLRIVGHISRPVFGDGRLTPDRQMFFVNSRPCALPQIAKAVNDVYRSFNYAQSPFIFANIVMDTTRYDVNVSPDKRTILLHDQLQLIDSLKVKLHDLFNDQEQTVPVSQIPFQGFKSQLHGGKPSVNSQPSLHNSEKDENQTPQSLTGPRLVDTHPDEGDNALILADAQPNHVPESSRASMNPQVNIATPPTKEEAIDRHQDEHEHRSSEAARIKAIVREAEGTAEQSKQQTSNRIHRSLRGIQGSSSVLNVVGQVKASADAMKTSTHRRTSGSPTASAEQTIPGHLSEEERLSLTIARSDFARMRVIGQFNLGFILAVRSVPESQVDDMFIIDQHASDEICNFSRLSLNTVLTPQPLARPHKLHLTAIEEETVLIHKDNTLFKNGFSVEVDTSGISPVGERCKLLTVPTSQETVFGLEDLEELLALLNDSPAPVANSIDMQPFLRPTKVRKMLAMRACRSSIMVGHTLSVNGMQRVLRQMGEIERPWNCPHGRPTMRHLAGLDGWSTWDERDGSERTDWQGWIKSCK